MKTTNADSDASASDPLFYLMLNDEPAGPFTFGQLRAMWQNGKITVETKYCPAGEKEWKRLKELRAKLEPELVPPSTPPPPLPSLPPAPAGQAVPNPELLGVIMLVVPIVAILLMWQWVGSMNLLQNPASSLQMIVILTIVGTATLGAVEASRLGIGSEADIKNGKKQSGPGVWFLFILVMWILGFPMYLYWRSRYGRKNDLGVGIVAAVLFAGVAYTMGATIEDARLRLLIERKW